MTRTSAAFARWATTEASTKRSPDVASGKIGARATNLSSVYITPVMPITPELTERYQIESPRTTYVTYAQGSPDIEGGDQLIVSSTEYLVKSVGVWPTDNSFLEIIIEKPKGV